MNWKPSEIARKIKAHRDNEVLTKALREVERLTGENDNLSVSAKNDGSRMDDLERMIEKDQSALSEAKKLGQNLVEAVNDFFPFGEHNVNCDHSLGCTCGFWDARNKLHEALEVMPEHLFPFSEIDEGIAEETGEESDAK